MRSSDPTHAEISAGGTTVTRYELFDSATGNYTGPYTSLEDVYGYLRSLPEVALQNLTLEYETDGGEFGLAVTGLELAARLQESVALPPVELTPTVAASAGRI